jgi:hypothetical protein
MRNVVENVTRFFGPWNSLKWTRMFQSKRDQKLTRWDMGKVRVISTVDAVLFPRVSIQIPALRRTELHTLSNLLVSLASPDTHSLLAVIPLRHWSALNTPWILGVSTTKIQRIKVRRLWRPVDWTTVYHPLFSEGLIQVLSAWRKRDGGPHHAWTTRPEL